SRAAPYGNSEMIFVTSSSGQAQAVRLRTKPRLPLASAYLAMLLLFAVSMIWTTFALVTMAQGFLAFFSVEKRAGVNNGVNKSTILQKAQQCRDANQRPPSLSIWPPTRAMLVRNS